MPFTFTKCPIDGLFEISPKVFGDNRGYFFESYTEKDFFEAGLTMKFVQDNQSLSKKGVLRGLHFQEKFPQGKLVRAISGQVIDIAVDLRKNSKTFGKYHFVLLDSEKQNQFYIPEGFAHGFYVKSESAIFAYKCTDYYHPECESGIIWNDPVINIDWKNIIDIDFENIILSEKDKKLPLFDKNKVYFDL